jgi:hypothetical protein
MHESYDIKKYVLKMAVKSLEKAEIDCIKIADAVELVCGNKPTLQKAVMDRCEDILVSRTNTRLERV